MKNYREMAEDVLRRAEEETQKRRKSRRTAWMIAVPAVCAAVLLAVIFWPKAGTGLPGATAAAQSLDEQHVQSQNEPQAGAVQVHLDYPVAVSLEDMIDAADYIVLGEYTGYRGSWNMARDPTDIRQDDSENTVEGRLYDFRIGQVLKGSVDEETILVNQTWSVRIPILDSDAEFDAEGRVIRESTESRTVPVTVQSSLFIEPEYGCSYLLFLLRDEHFGNYYAAVEPFQIKLENGTAVLQSNLLEGTEAPAQTVELENGKKITVSLGAGSLKIEDFLTGRTEAALLGDIRSRTQTNEAALQIPSVELPEPEEEMAADMIGLVVYNGAVYTQARDYFGRDAEAVRGLIGDYLGRAKGNIDEWSSQDEYAAEFASTVVGDVHTVVGYSPDFRICVTNRLQAADGGEELWIQFLERLNGIGVSTGADLYEARLRVNVRVSGVRSQRYDDWNNGLGNFRPFEQTEALDAFLEALNEGEFFYVYDDDPGSYRDTRTQAFLYLTLADGSVVALRLIEGGWVGYDAMPWYFIRLPAEVFDPVVAAAGG